MTHEVKSLDERLRTKAREGLRAEIHRELLPARRLLNGSRSPYGIEVTVLQYAAGRHPSLPEVLDLFETALYEGLAQDREQAAVDQFIESVNQMQARIADLEGASHD